MHIVPQFANKKGNFHRDAGRAYDSPEVAWHSTVASDEVYPEGVDEVTGEEFFTDDQIGMVEDTIIRHSRNATMKDWVYRVVFVDDASSLGVIMEPFAMGDVGALAQMVIRNPRPQQPNWVAGEEEEEHILYRSSR